MDTFKNFGYLDATPAASNGRGFVTYDPNSGVFIGYTAASPEDMARGFSFPILEALEIFNLLVGETMEDRKTGAITTRLY